jgi:hypothetical protein
MFGILSLLQPASAAEAAIAAERRSDHNAGGGYNTCVERRSKASTSFPPSLPTQSINALALPNGFSDAA